MLVTINKYPITAPFRSIDIVHGLPHKGIDFAMPMNTPIPSVGDGVITAITNEGNRSFGLAVHMKLKDGTDIIYGHLSNTNVKVGQTISFGDIIGYSGNSGDSTGPHLHLQAMSYGIPTDPMKYIQPQNKGFMGTTIDDIREAAKFFSDLHTNGFWHSITGKFFGQWCYDVFQTFLDASTYIAIALVMVFLFYGLFGAKKAGQLTYWTVATYTILQIFGRIIIN